MTFRWQPLASSLFATYDGSHQLQASNSRTRDCYGAEATRGRCRAEIAAESAVCRAVRSPASPFIARSPGEALTAARSAAGGTLRAIA
jgi:hypothetical protein